MTRIRAFATMISFALAGCDVTDTAPLPVETDEARELIAHQWGTYTSIHSSDGESIPGVHRAEKPLPSFVHRASDAPPTSVIHQLDASFLYFQSTPGRAAIEAGFAGQLTDWFPLPASLPPRSMRWDIALVDAIGSYRPVSDGEAWAWARRVEGQTVRVAGEEERFLFYRGPASFDRALRVSSSTGHGEVFLTIENQSSEPVPAAFWIHVDEEGGGVIAPIGELAAGSRAWLTAGDHPLVNIREYMAEGRSMLTDALEAEGLRHDDAQWMFNTQSRSYFEPGMRILYIAPRAWVDELMPLAIDPQPRELVRAFVGRIEVFAPPMVGDVARHIGEAYRGERTFAPDEYGRFTEAKLRHVLELIRDDAVRTFGEQLLEQAAAMP